MAEMEANPDSALNVKLRGAGITSPPSRFVDSVSIIADPRKLAGIPPERIEDAMYSAIDFMVDHYVAQGGQPSPFFKTIDLAAERSDGLIDLVWRNDHLSLKPGGSLAIEVPKNLYTGGEARPLTAEDLHEEWDTGKQFSEASMRLVWPLMNPVGPLRSTLRASMKGNADELGLDLGRIKQRLAAKVPGGREELKSLARRFLPADARTNDGRDLRTVAEEKIAAASPEELTRIVEGWKQNVLSGSFRDEVLGQVVDIAIETQPRIRSHAYGLVAIANSHQIDVKADATIGASSVRRFISKPSAGDRETDVLAAGLVAISTQDTINVSATISNLKDPVSAAVGGEGLARVLDV